MSFFTPEKVQPNIHSNNDSLTSRGSNDQLSRSFCSNELIGGSSPNQLFKNRVASCFDRIMNGSIDCLDCDHPSQRSIRPNENRDRDVSQNRSKLHRKLRRNDQEIVESDRPIKHSSSSKRHEKKTGHFGGSESQKYSGMSSDQGSRSGSVVRENLKKSRRRENKSYIETTLSNFCECQIHSRKHKNCCNCSEPYHQTVCNCLQHGESHGYCCRCDPELLKKYDLYLNKKRYLNLLSNRRNSQVCDASSETGPDLDDVKTPEPITSDQVFGDDDSTADRRLLPLLTGAPSRKFDIGDILSGEQERKQPKIICRECSHSSQNLRDVPCSVCCQKLNTIHDMATQEIYNMLVAISKSLQPSTHCCLLENLIKELKPPKQCHKHLRCSDCSMSSIQGSLDSNLSVPVDHDSPAAESQVLSATCDAAVQVDSYNGKTSDDSVKDSNIKETKSFKKKLRSSCTIS